MHVLGVRDGERMATRSRRLSIGPSIGSPSEAASGSSGTIRRSPTVRTRESITFGGDVTYDLGVDGDWLASGTGCPSVTRSTVWRPTASTRSPSARRRFAIPRSSWDQPTSSASRPVTLSRASTTPATSNSMPWWGRRVGRAPRDARVAGGPHQTIAAGQQGGARSRPSPAGSARKTVRTTRAHPAPRVEKYEGVADERMAALEAGSRGSRRRLRRRTLPPDGCRRGRRGHRFRRRPRRPPRGGVSNRRRRDQPPERRGTAVQEGSHGRGRVLGPRSAVTVLFVRRSR